MKFFLNILIVLSFCVGCYALFGEDSELDNIFYIPFVFSLFLFVFQKSLINLRQSWVLMVLLAQMVIRFIVIPLYVSLGGTFDRSTASLYTDYAVFFIVLEMFAVFVVLSLIGIKKFSVPARSNLTLIRPNKHFIALSLLAAGFVLLFSQGYMFKVNFIWNLNEFWADKELRDAAKNVEGLYELLFQLLRVVALLVGLSLISRSRWSQFVKWIMSFMIIMLNAAIIVGSSRFSIVFATLPAILVLMQLYPQYKKRILILGGFGFFAVILISSLTKFSTATYKADSSDIFGLKFLNAYFTGVGNIAVGLEGYANSSQNEGSIYFVSDIFQNVPGVAGSINSNYKTSIVYNNNFYGLTTLNSDQIVPVTISAIYHFGYYFFFIYSIIFTWLAFYFERKMFSASFVGSYYIFGLLALSSSLFMMLTLGSLVSNIVKNLFFVLIPILILNDGLYFLFNRNKSKINLYR